MTATKKIYNKGQRHIAFDKEGSMLAPLTGVELPAKMADKLLGLYADELQDMDSVTKAFNKSVAPAPKAAPATDTATPDAKETDKDSDDTGAKEDGTGGADDTGSATDTANAPENKGLMAKMFGA